MLYVIAIGGNAISDEKSVDAVSKEVASLYKRGARIVITHGNGPQVGELAEKEDQNLALLTAQTEAWIGMVIESRLGAALQKHGFRNYPNIVSVVMTKVLVDEKSSEFRNPSKPVGRFYSKKEAERLKRKGYTIKKVIGGYRRVVPSPKPLKILDKETIIEQLDDKKIVIACGGGGISVAKRGNALKYVEAVIDKDRASALLAEQIHADRLIILTNVDGAYINFKKKDRRMLQKIKVVDLERYLKDGQFESGSMQPKIESCIEFVRKTGKPAAIGNLLSPDDAINLRHSTCVVK